MNAEKIIKSLDGKVIGGIVGMCRNRSLIIGERGKNIIVHGDPPEIWGWGNSNRKS